jgi:hypothetical protein
MCASRGLVAGLVRIAHIVIILGLQQSQEHSARALRERRSRLSYYFYQSGLQISSPAYSPQNKGLAVTLVRAPFILISPRYLQGIVGCVPYLITRIMTEPNTSGWYGEDGHSVWDTLRTFLRNLWNPCWGIRQVQLKRCHKLDRSFECHYSCQKDEGPTRGVPAY